jgi:hypothetical protein
MLCSASVFVMSYLTDPNSGFKAKYPRVSGIRLIEVAISRPPGEKKIMAVISGYFDDSRKENYVLTLAGLVGDEDQWQHFENRWADLLKKHDVPYLHMKEMMRPKGPFSKWLPHEAHRAEVANFFIDVTDAINSSRLHSYSTIVRLLDLEKFNNAVGLQLKAYPLGAYGCMTLIHKAYPTARLISLVFDHCDKIDSYLRVAKKYAAGDRTFPGIVDHIVPIPLPKQCTAKEVRPIQAADFMAHEIRKHHLKQTEWWEQAELHELGDRRFERFKRWSREKFGSNLPPPRKTLEAIAKQCRMSGLAFDYSALVRIHQDRGGVW